MYTKLYNPLNRIPGWGRLIDKHRISEVFQGITRQLLIASCVFLFIWMPGVFAAQRFSMAPTNPDFLNYQARLKQGETPGISDEGRGLGHIPPLLDLSHTAGQVSSQLYELLGFPDSYDLRTLGRVTPVKDQGDCGSCWVCATYGSLESYLMPGEEWDFSENNMKNTHGFDLDACEGGNILMSSAYLGRWSGPILEVDDPYNPYNDYSPPGLVTQKHVQEVLFLPDRTGPSDNDRIKQAVMTYGAVYTSFYWNSIYYDPWTYGYYFNGVNPGNHGVAVVGWDDYYDRSNFIVQPPGDGAFLLKNSWGTSWGDSGYFYISYYDTVMGHEDDAVFQNAEPTTNYLSVYQYDPLGWVSALGDYSDTAWFANVFTADESEQLAAVSFYTAAVDSTYEVYIYLNPASPPVGSMVESSESGILSYPGYHTVVLNTPVELAEDDEFSVVVRLTTPGYIWPIPIEYAVAEYSSAAGALPGESFVSTDGISWLDATVVDSSANVCLKAFTKSLGEICNGDFDNDGDVDGTDLAVFSADFGRADCGIAPVCEGDFNGDNDVDGSDLALFSADFGRTDCVVEP